MLFCILKSFLALGFPTTSILVFICSLDEFLSCYRGSNFYDKMLHLTALFRLFWLMSVSYIIALSTASGFTGGLDNV